MMSYVYTLLRSGLPFSAEGVIGIWVLLFVANHMLSRAVRAANARQTLVTIENREALYRASRPEWLLVQIAYAAAVFALSLYLDPALFVFLGGGVVVMLAGILGLNLQALLVAHAMLRDGSGGGITLSTGLAYRQLGSRLAGMALTFAVCGLLLAHLALLGGALLSAANASGYYRRARQQERAVR